MDVNDGHRGAAVITAHGNVARTPLTAPLGVAALPAATRDDRGRTDAGCGSSA